MEDALIVAASQNDVSLVKQLIQRGVDVNGVDGYGYTSLYCAACRGFAECAQLLLEAKADVDKADSYGGWTPVFVASKWGYMECVKVGWLRYLFVLFWR